MGTGGGGGYCLNSISSKFDSSFSFDPKLGSSVLEFCSRPEKWAHRSSVFGLAYTQNLTINGQDSKQEKKRRQKATEKQPIWLSQSTVERAATATSNSVGKFSEFTN